MPCHLALCCGVRGERREETQGKVTEAQVQFSGPLSQERLPVLGPWASDTSVWERLAMKLGCAVGSGSKKSTWAGQQDLTPPGPLTG